MENKVTILKSVYDIEKDMIIWDVRFHKDNKYQKFCIPSSDIIKALNIKGNVEPHHLVKFCEDMNGKDINLLINGEPMFNSPEINEKQTSDVMEKVANHLSGLRRH